MFALHLLLISFAPLALASNIAPTLDEISARYIGTPYANDNLGEGPGSPYDADPLIRDDAFDCTTYIEFVVAAARSSNEATLLTQMNLLRYQNGIVGFWTRNHFPSLDWVPNAIRHGFVQDVSALVAGPELAIAETIIDKPAWAARLPVSRISRPDAPTLSTAELEALAQELRDEGMRTTTAQLAQLPYVPLTSLIDDATMLARVPHGSIANIVRPAWDLTAAIGTRLNVSHQGLLFWREGTLLFRHASSTVGQVTEEPFTSYLSRFRNSPTIRGVNILEVLPATP